MAATMCRSRVILRALLALAMLRGSTSWTVLRKTSHTYGSALFAGDDSSEESKNTSAGLPQSPARVRVVHRPIRRAAVATAEASLLKQQAAERRHAEALQDPTLLSNVPFSEVGLSPAVVRSLAEVMGLKQMTDIQVKCFAPASEGKSFVAQSRTGSGKTLAFLLPIGQRLVAEKGRVNALIVAPTRELASQIAAEAKSLFQFDETITIFSVHGGGSFGNDRRALRRRRPTILVATPGRLLDLLESKIALSPNILVLDEFDRLLEGSPELAKCLPFLPRASKRQTMMFSATLTQKTELYKAFFGSTEYETIGGTDSEGNGSNLCQLEELTIRLPDMKAYLTFLVSILAQERERKVMVFLPTNKLVKFVNECFGANGWKQCWSIHSHMSNGSRERASQSFNESPNGILFSSDVSARGLDYPDVDLVLQYGLASSRALHLHRQGRTARAGKRGRSVVVRMPFEAKLSKDSRSYAVNEQTSLPTEFENRVRALVTSGHPVLGVSADSAAKSFAVYYLRHSNLSATSLTETTSMIARAFGLSESWELPDDFDLNPVVARGRKVRPS